MTKKASQKEKKFESFLDELDVLPRGRLLVYMECPFEAGKNSTC
jgi:hypothetical protein